MTAPHDRSVVASARAWGRRAAESGQPRTAPYRSLFLQAVWCEAYDEVIREQARQELANRARRMEACLDSD